MRQSANTYEYQSRREEQKMRDAYIEALNAADSVDNDPIPETPASELITSCDGKEGVIVDLDDHPQVKALTPDMMPTIDDGLSL